MKPTSLRDQTIFGIVASMQSWHEHGVAPHGMNRLIRDWWPGATETEVAAAVERFHATMARRTSVGNEKTRLQQRLDGLARRAGRTRPGITDALLSPLPAPGSTVDPALAAEIETLRRDLLRFALDIVSAASALELSEVA